MTAPANAPTMPPTCVPDIACPSTSIVPAAPPNIAPNAPPNTNPTATPPTVIIMASIKLDTNRNPNPTRDSALAPIVYSSMIVK